MSIRLKLRGVITDIFNKNPKSIPEKVVNNALLLVLYHNVECLSSLSDKLSSSDIVTLPYSKWSP